MHGYQKTCASYISLSVHVKIRYIVGITPNKRVSEYRTKMPPKREQVIQLRTRQVNTQTKFFKLVFSLYKMLTMFSYYCTRNEKVIKQKKLKNNITKSFF